MKKGIYWFMGWKVLGGSCRQPSTQGSKCVIGIDEARNPSALLSILLTPFSGRLLTDVLAFQADGYKTAAAAQPTCFHVQISRCRGVGA